MIPKQLSLLLIFLCVVSPSWALGPPDPLARHLFPPELVMRHQRVLDLSDEQLTAIKSEMQESQKRFLDLRWQIEKEMETMEVLLNQDKADEKQVVAQLDKVLDIEREIKRARLVMLIRVKDLLTPEQKAKLADVKEKLRPRPSPPAR